MVDCVVQTPIYLQLWQEDRSGGRTLVCTVRRALSAVAVVKGLYRRMHTGPYCSRGRSVLEDVPWSVLSDGHCLL
jgi:hypothetical protein